MKGSGKPKSDLVWIILLLVSLLLFLGGGVLLFLTDW